MKIVVREGWGPAESEGALLDLRLLRAGRPHPQETSHAFPESWLEMGTVDPPIQEQEWKAQQWL